MKKLVAALTVLIAFTLFASGTAEVSQSWSNGQSPAQPYKGVPPVDLTKKLGYMVLDPLNNENADGILNSLKLYLPREDVKAGGGALRLYEEGVEAPIREIAFDDAARVSASPINQETLAWLYWESGVCFTVQLGDALDVDKAYYASLDEGAVLASDYEGVMNAALDGQKGWTFTTNADAGVLSRARSGGDAPMVGDSVTVQVKLGGEAVAAAIFCENGAVDSEDEPLAADGALTATYAQAGEAKWGVALMDESGALVGVFHYDEEVSPS